MNSMEVIINLVTAGFTIFMVTFVERVMYSFPLEKKEISDYQDVLDKADIKARVKHGLEFKHDARTKLTEQRKLTKGFTLIFSGFFLALALITLIFVTTTLSFMNIGIICISAIILICYGMIKIAESKKLAIGMLAVVFIMGTLGKFALDELMVLSPYAYFYLCGLVVLLGVFSFIPKLKKTNAKIVLLFLIISTLFTTQTWAQKNDNNDSKEFKKLYKQTVARINSEKRDTVEFRNFRLNDFAISSIVYEKTHECLCNDKQCHGPRLILTANFGKTNIFVFPNGYCFSETNYFTEGINMVKIDPEAEAVAKAAFKKAAKEVLLAYTK